MDDMRQSTPHHGIKLWFPLKLHKGGSVAKLT